MFYEDLMKLLTVTQNVSNPNFVEDLMRFICPQMDQEQVHSVLERIREKSPTMYEKLETLTDRIEFVGHLEVIKAEASRQEFRFGSSEIRGVHWDIDALRLYLALTCVDILSTNFQPFDEWLTENCADIMEGEEIKRYLKRKSLEYRDEFRLSSNFVKAFKCASDGLKKRICEHLAVIKGDSKSSDIGRIAAYLYRVRNKYTHEGRRFFAAPILFKRIQAIGVRDEEILLLLEGFDVVDVVLEVAKEQAARQLLEYEEQCASQRISSVSDGG